jgi:hypothetical protein
MHRHALATSGEGSGTPRLVARLWRRAQLKGLVSGRKRIRGACQCSDFAADAPLWASNSLDGFDRLLPQPAPLPTNPTVARCRCGVGPCLAPRRDLHSALQLEPFELRPIGGSTPPAIFSPAWHLPFHDRVGYHYGRMYRIVRDRHIIPSYPSTPQRRQTTFSAAARTGRVIDLAFVHLDHDDADSPALARLSRDVAANRPTDATRPEEVDVFARVLLRSGRMMIRYGCVRTRA